jgi:hypothetical protein
MGRVDWSMKAEERISRGDDGDGYRRANADIVTRAVDGIGIDSGRVREADGVRVVYNVSSAHLPKILASGYENCYHRAGQRTIGTPQPVSRRRLDVDMAIAAAISPPARHEDIHYGAVELNGVGMRYYGDVCIVLKSAEFCADTVVLSHNSYDLTRSPMRDIIATGSETVETLVKSIVGTRRDVASMLVCKIISDRSAEERLLTVGRISASLLEDEDYFEVVRLSPFTAKDIEEIRVSAAEATLELHIGDLQRQGLTPTLAELIWRHRREQARKAAAAQDIPYRIVTTDGRVRG